MDTKQQKQVNEAAEKFAEALRESYKTVAERTVSAQQLNAELTQTFFNSVIGNLRAQADSNRETAGELIEQQQKQREATQALTQESVNAYMDFLNSIFSYYQGNMDRIQQETQRNLDRAEQDTQRNLDRAQQDTERNLNRAQRDAERDAERK